MKVFEVILEQCDNDKEIKSIIYVTSENNTFKSISNYYVNHCNEFNYDLISIREVLTIAVRI